MVIIVIINSIIISIMNSILSPQTVSDPIQPRDRGEADACSCVGKTTGTCGRLGFWEMIISILTIVLLLLLLILVL